MIHQYKLHQKRKSASPEDRTNGLVKMPKYRNERLERDYSTVKTIRGQMRSATLQAAKAQILRGLGKISWAGPRIGSLCVVRCSTVVAKPLPARKTVVQSPDPLHFPMVANPRRLL
jgi:hypothetical protein